MREKGAMSESCSWLFVENVPLLFRKEKVAQQLKVETWLDLTQLLKELKQDGEKELQSTPYVV